MLNSKTSNQKIKNSLKNISNAAKDSRYVFSIFKVFKDSVLIHQVLKSPIDYNLSYFLKNACLLNHFLFNFYGNIKLYNKLKCFKKDNSKYYSKVFQSFWAIYIIFNISKHYNDYRNLIPSENKNLDYLKKKILIIQMISSASDWLICLNGSGFAKGVTGYNIPEFWRGLGGTVSASLSLYASKLNDKI